MISSSINYLIYSPSDLEDVSTAEYLENNDLAIYFVLLLSLEAHEELRILDEHVNNIHREVLQPDEWSYLCGPKDFSAHKYYRFLLRDICRVPFLPKIWKTKSMMRAKVFSWVLTMDRINAREMLVWRNSPIPNVNFVICQLHGETSDHLFFTCHFGAACWSTSGIVWDTSIDLSSRISRDPRLLNKLLFALHPSCFEHLETKEQEAF